MIRSQDGSRKPYPTSTIDDERDDEHMDRIIRQMFQNWLTYIEVPPILQISAFQISKKGLNTERDKEVKMWQNDWNLLYHMQYEHHLELIREADLSRLLQTSKVFVPKKPALNKRLFSWIGRLMIALGTNMIKRFEPAPSDLSTSTTLV